MKTSICSRITAILVTVMLLLPMLSLFVVASDGFCFHETERKLIETQTGYTIVNVCKNCGQTISDVGYVDASEKITLYKGSDKSVAYTEEELQKGISSASGESLFVDDNVVSASGTPYWLTFDLKVNAVPTIAEGDAQANAESNAYRAYKGWSVIAIVHNNKTYDTVLRLIADGWEAESGVSGAVMGEKDGISPIKPFGDNDTFRNQATVIDVKAGDVISFAIRVNPANGNYDIYIGDSFIMTATTNAQSADDKPFIRLWEYNGVNYGGLLDFTNISMFEDKYTAVVHNHSYTEFIEFYDEGVFKYEICDCGNKNELECESIASVVADGLAHIYDGVGSFEINSDGYWFVTDVNIRSKISDGNLIKFGDDVILEVRNGKLMSGNMTLGTVGYPASYQIAVEVENNGYKLYLNGRYAVNGSLSDTVNITCGDASFGYGVRFMYNKAVTLGDTDSPVVPTYVADSSVKLCYHSDSGTVVPKTSAHPTSEGVKYVYTCSKCGERVYSMLLKNLTNPANDTEYAYNPSMLTLDELKGFSTDKPRYLYVGDNVISTSADPYWITFDVTPNEIPSNPTGSLIDPNSRAYKGYALVSSEPAFLPISELRVIPDGWEEGSGANGKTKGTADGKAEVKLIKPSEEVHIGMNTTTYRFAETVAYLEVGKTTSFALHIDPKTGVYHVYVDGAYKASSEKISYTDMTPKIAFHDNGLGEFTYSNVKLCAEAQDFDDKIVEMELTAKFAADANASANAYTSLLAIERGDARYNLFYANNKNGTLCFKNEAGDILELYDFEGNAITLDTAKRIAVVYDDINGDVRYYYEDKLAQYKNEGKLIFANGIKVYDADFVSAKGGADVLRFNPTNVSVLSVKGLGNSDTAEIIGFQSHEIVNSIRILSGVDSLYYGASGYEVRAYMEDGTPYEEQPTVKSATEVYSSVIADGKTLVPENYGYSYFSALAIDGDFLGYKGSYIIVTPFTVIGNETYYGEGVRLNILDYGKYEFAEKN